MQEFFIQLIYFLLDILSIGTYIEQQEMLLTPQRLLYSLEYSNNKEFFLNFKKGAKSCMGKTFVLVVI